MDVACRPEAAPSQRREEGIAVVTVLLVTLVVTILVTTTLTYASASQGQSRRSQDWNAALPAAEAGVDDYITRLNANEAYTVHSSTNPDPANPAFAGFIPVAGAANDASFSYQVSTTKFPKDGTIEVTSTGRVNGVDRTVRTTLGRAGFIEYLYFTDFETTDPELYQTQALKDTYGNTCATYYYAGRKDTTGCAQFDIQFASGDLIKGPAHSNDAMLMAPASGGPRFLGPLSTSYDVGDRWRRTSATPTSSNPKPTFAVAGDPKLVGPKLIPPTNVELFNLSQAPGGCLFTGPTSVKLQADGTMKVRSPYTKVTSCWKNGTEVMGTTERTIPLPANGVLYVQGVPATGPNATAGCASSTGRNPLGYPISNDITKYGCRTGDLFIEGVLDGQLTASAENDIIVTWDLKHESGVTGDDLLGLIAVNNVEVYHPVDLDDGDYENLNARTSSCGSRGGSSCRFTNPVIQASILTLQHSFTVQNYNRGNSLGTLTVDGSIAQKFRGPVGTSGGTGVLKNYVYDDRLKFLSPPNFLKPVDSPWRVVLWEER